MGFKLFKKTLIVFLVLAVAAAGFYFLYMRPRRVTPILMYHAVRDDRSSTLNVTPENFSRQMAFLRESGYSVISLDDLVRHIRKGRRFVPGAVVITFDDGYEDNYFHAFPVLKKYDMPATIFLITGYTGTRKGYMKWDQVRAMMKSNIDFGGHTMNDVYLPSLEDDGRLWEEIYGCREDILRNAGGEAGYFCYPIGGFNERVKNTVKKAGYKGACTTNRGDDRFNRDVYELKRIKVTNSDMNKPLHFRAKLSGYYNLFRSVKSGE
ncbi:MAG: polysaccharide deacetylase family protein [Candidatus Omnitrophota bacterium]|nr:polysaccharide deacetylase family protein [Candidatus Omnitrophota bacterium]